MKLIYPGPEYLTADADHIAAVPEGDGVVIAHPPGTDAEGLLCGEEILLETVE